MVWLLDLLLLLLLVRYLGLVPALYLIVPLGFLVHGLYKAVPRVHRNMREARRARRARNHR